VAWDPQQSLPGLVREKGIPQYALLQDGMICWFDFEHPELSDQLADLSWFMHYPDFDKAAHSHGGGGAAAEEPAAAADRGRR
jgi:hypothetical protein